MAKILIVYHSQTWNTEKMAASVAKGANDIAGTTVVLRNAFAATLRDLLECDGLIIGSPEYFGYMAGAIKDLFDRTYEKLREDKRVFRKPYGVFVSAGNDGQGAVRHIERIGIGFQFKKVHHPVVSRGAVTEEVLSCCEELGKTIAAGCKEGIF